MDKIKVLHLTPASSIHGGVYSFIFNYYKLIDQDRFQFDFLTQNSDLMYAPEYSEFKYNVHILHTTASIDKEGFVNEIKEILKEGYDILHLHTSYWTGFLIEEIAMQMKVKKIIVHSHSSYIEENNVEKREILFKQHEIFKMQFSEAYATDFWACSNKAADWLFGRQISKNKIQLIANAIELKKFKYKEDTRNNIRKQLHIDDEIVLGNVGRLSYSKNQEFLIELFYKFHKKYKKSKLVIVGDGELREQLVQKCKYYHLESDIILTGWQTNVEDYYQCMDFFLLPSRFEGFPISIMEASASGLPCLISDNITKEVLIMDSIKIETCDIEEWISILESWMKKEIDRKGTYQYLKQKGFDIEDQVKRLERLYEE